VSTAATMLNGTSLIHQQLKISDYRNKWVQVTPSVQTCISEDDLSTTDDISSAAT
jgi:hypothetical protein